MGTILNDRAMTLPTITPPVLGQYFARLEGILAGCDQLFREMKERYPKELRCQKGCDDCCHHGLDLSLLEALYLNDAFHRASRGLRRDLQRNTARAEAKLKALDLKRNGVIDINQYEAQIATLDTLRVTCPLLIDGACALYQHRPAMCRIFGIPLRGDSVATSCPQNGFAAGEAYPAVNFSAIRRNILQIESELSRPPNRSASYRILMVDALRLDVDSLDWQRLEDSFLAIVPVSILTAPEQE